MRYVLLSMLIVSKAFAFNYHGCTLAPDNIHGWVVCLDTVLILHTNDGGITWQEQANIPPDSVYRFFDVTCIDQYSAWTCGFLGQILHTDNGGLDWYGQAIALSKYATRIEFIDQDYGWVACGDGTIALTTNGGNYWDYFSIPPYNYEFYGISFVSEWDGWVVSGYPDSIATGQGTIWRSIDGGFTWDSLYQVADSADFFDVYFLNLSEGIVIGGDETNGYIPIILRTTDGGVNWDTITAPANSYFLRALDFVDNEGWAVGKFGTIIHTTDGGITWTFQPSPATNTLFDVDFSDHQHGLACGYDIILRTSDGGQNWYAVGIEEQSKDLILGSTKLKVYPNPCREKTAITLQIEDCGLRNEEINLKIYDTAGRLVKSIKQLTNHQSPINQVIWDGTDFSGNKVMPGVYFVKLNSSKHIISEKIVLSE